ncbi:hypothetical protein BsWGS_25323 [Bradybaena similaris]
MAGGSDVPKVETGNKTQAKIDTFFVQKAESLQTLKSKRAIALKKRNNLVGLLLAGGVLGIYAYTMFSVRQGKMMEAFDKTPE